MIRRKISITGLWGSLGRWRRRWGRGMASRRVIGSGWRRRKIRGLKGSLIRSIHSNRILTNGPKFAYLILPIFRKFTILLINALAIWKNVSKDFLKICKFSVNYLNFMSRKAPKVNSQAITFHK
jgi:hypothetical protein